MSTPSDLIEVAKLAEAKEFVSTAEHCLVILRITTADGVQTNYQVTSEILIGLDQTPCRWPTARARRSRNAIMSAHVATRVEECRYEC
jgi:hypothetical protein